MKTEPLNSAICAEMFNWHQHQADSLERKLQLSRDGAKRKRKPDPELLEHYQMHRRFQTELAKLFSAACRGEEPLLR